MPPGRSQEDIKARVERDGGCSDCDLSGFDFEDLANSDNLTFANCKLSKTTLRGDALSSSKWENCTFLECQFVGTQLRDSVFLRCSFFDADQTTGSQFRFCDIVRACFVECNLSLSKLLRCDAFEVVFRDCMMRGIVFEATTFHHKIGAKFFNKAIFERCRLTDATLASLNLTGSEWRECDLTDANLSETRFVNAELCECDLTGADVEDADFSGADLRKSRLSGFSLTDIAGYASMRVSAREQHHLLQSLGIEVWPDD
jgi:fluoroquinolone resistance protein